MRFSKSIQLKFYIILVAVFICLNANAQILVPSLNPWAYSMPSKDQNFILTRTYKVAGISVYDEKNAHTFKEVSQLVKYVDGLGRPKQSVDIGASPGLKDIVQPIAYDIFGRENKKYLPYPAFRNGGAFREGALVTQAVFYNDPSIIAPGVKSIPNAAFSETEYEPSPLNRPIQQGSPGTDWQLSSGHTEKNKYSANIANEVLLWNLTATGAASINSFYPEGKLYKTITFDENGIPAQGKAGSTEEFKDFDGRVILKRKWETNIKSLSTYYVYDELGNLRYVLPPAVNEHTDKLPAAINSFTENDDNFEKYIYGYHYDFKSRLTEKKIPGKGWESMVYNKLNLVTHTQDANQKAKNQWSWTKYDAFGRIVIIGIENGQTTDRSNMQTYNDGIEPQWEERTNSTAEGYTENTHPNAGESNANIEFHLVNYYDDYNFPGYNSSYHPTTVVSTYTKGLQTASLVRILGTNTKLLTVMYYDDEGRLVETVAANHLGGIDRVVNTYNFTDEIVSSLRNHTANGVTTNIQLTYEYNHNGLKTKTWEQITTNGQAPGENVLLSELVYNELSQLIEKKLHNGMQTTGFDYNERGWLKNSISDQFTMELRYNDGTTPQFNGNIANQIYTNGSTNTFNYAYDKLNRLLQASAGNNLGETISYDIMGNITSLTRDGFGTNSYTGYNGNKLTAISGFTNSNYLYGDFNGNLTGDSQKNITLSYNHLNLPQEITGSQHLIYTYDALGVKLKKQSSINGTTDYVGGIQYTNSNIDFIQTGEGIARNNGGVYSYEYNLTDHLGNVRITFKQSPPPLSGLEIIQRDNYYAFGLRQSPPVQAGTNKYLYNGKELQEELNQYDYGARFYDPVIGRFNTIDPLSELSRRNSPYGYALNNPIRFIDVDGMYASPKTGKLKQGDYGFDELFAEFENAFSRMELNDSDFSLEQVDPNKQKPKPQTGSYTNVHKTGKKYHGKGSEQRAAVSGARIARDEDDPLVSTDWTPAPNDRQAFKDEDDRMQTDEGGHKSKKNYNKRASPGEKYKKEDQEKEDKKKKAQSEEPDLSRTMKNLTPIDGLRVRPFNSYNLPAITKPNPIIIIGGAIGTLIIGALVLTGG